MSTVTVACKLEGGQLLELGRVRDNRGEWTKGPDFRSVRLAQGINHDLDGDLVQEWLRLHRDTAAVQHGHIRIVADDGTDYENSTGQHAVWRLPVGTHS